MQSSVFHEHNSRSPNHAGTSKLLPIALGGKDDTTARYSFFWFLILLFFARIYCFSCFALNKIHQIYVPRKSNVITCYLNYTQIHIYDWFFCMRTVHFLVYAYTSKLRFQACVNDHLHRRSSVLQDIICCECKNGVNCFSSRRRYMQCPHIPHGAC